MFRQILIIYAASQALLIYCAHSLQLVSYFTTARIESISVKDIRSDFNINIRARICRKELCLLKSLVQAPHVSFLYTVINKEVKTKITHKV